MPIYEYMCREHGTIVPKVAQMSDSPAPLVHGDYCEPGYECTYERILSSFSGRFGDTPRRHRT